MDPRKKTDNAMQRQAVDDLSRAFDDALKVVEGIEDYWKGDPDMCSFLAHEAGELEKGRYQILSHLDDMLVSSEEREKRETESDDEVHTARSRVGERSW